MMKVGDMVKGRWGTRVLSAVSEDGAFVNVSEDAADAGWWPSKCFEIVKRAETSKPLPTAEVHIVSEHGVVENYYLQPGDTLCLELGVKKQEGST